MEINGKISVLIPTCNRPEFLRTALGSVLAQSFLHRVAEVVVIENGGTRLSAQVCDQFPTLPIRYVFRDPPLPPENMARPALAEVSQGIVALLCDDDWWSNYHLESASSSLEARKDAVAYFCNVLWTAGEQNSYVQRLNHAWLPWFASKGKSRGGIHVLGEEDMIVATLVDTPFHFSGMVARKTVWERCLNIFDNGNPADVDRLLELEMTKYGPILFDQHPGAYIRSHPGQEAARLHYSGEARKWFNRSTLNILRYAQEKGFDLKRAFADRLEATGGDLKNLCACSAYGSVSYLASQGLIPPIGTSGPDEQYDQRLTALAQLADENQKIIDQIMNSKTFWVGKRLSKLKNLLFGVTARPQN